MAILCPSRTSQNHSYIREKEGGKSLCVGGRKQIIDFCLNITRSSSIFKAFAPEIEDGLPHRWITRKQRNIEDSGGPAPIHGALLGGALSGLTRLKLDYNTGILQRLMIPKKPRTPRYHLPFGPADGLVQLCLQQILGSSSIKYSATLISPRSSCSSSIWPL